MVQSANEKLIKRPLGVLPGLAVALAGFLVIYVLSVALEPIRPVAAAEWADEDLRVRGSSLRGFAFGADGLIADWYWMRSLQYVGEKVMASKDEFINVDDLRSLDPRLLHPYLDNATDLDPAFMAAYSYGALVLPAIDAEKAIALTRKGIQNNPDQWRLYQYLGYIYWRLKRFDEAAETYEHGSRIAGAPSFMRLMAGSMRNEGGSRETARSIFGQMAYESNDSESQYYGKFRLSQLDSLDEREAMNAAISAFRSRTDRCVAGWGELLPLLRAVELPNGREFRVDGQGRVVDPSNAPYLINAEKCEVELDPAQTKIPFN